MLRRWNGALVDQRGPSPARWSTQKTRPIDHFPRFARDPGAKILAWVHHTGRDSEQGGMAWVVDKCPLHAVRKMWV